MNAEAAYLFRHALLRDAAYQLQLPASRARLHGLALEIMERVLRPSAARHAPAKYAAELADHARAASENPRLGQRQRRSLQVSEQRYLTRAASHAKNRGNLADAAALLMRALAHPRAGKRDQTVLSLELAEVWQSTGELDKAVKLCTRLLKILPAQKAALQARALTALGGVLGDLGHAAKARAHLEAAAKICERAGDWKRLAHCLSVLALQQQTSGDTCGAKRNHERVQEIARRHRHAELLRSAYCGKAVFLQRAGQSAEAERLARLALELSAQDETSAPGRELNILHMILSATGRRREAQECMHQALELHRRCGNRRGEALALSNMANEEMRNGNLDLAQSQLGAANTIHEETGNRRSQAAVLAKLGVVAFTRNELERSTQFTRRALVLARETENMDIRKLATGNLGIIGLQVGAFKAAEHFYRESIALARQDQDKVFATCTEGHLAIALLLRGHLEEARSLALNAAAQVSARQHAVWRLSDILPALVRVHCAGWVAPGRGHCGPQELAQARLALAEMQQLTQAAGLADDTDSRARLVSCEGLVREAEKATDADRPPLIFRGHAPIDMEPLSRAAALDSLTAEQRQSLKQENQALFAALSEGVEGLEVPLWVKELDAAATCL